MSREIKFRLWNNAGNYSKYFFDYENVMECLKQQMYFNADINDKRGWNHIGDGSVFEQYTGLKDKNGVEIYEGDIITFQKFSNYEHPGFEMHFATVIFKDGCFMWDIFKFGTNSSFHRSDKNEPLKRTCATWGLEIIGNIHQNSELL